jgi:hypothetical protein
MEKVRDVSRSLLFLPQFRSKGISGESWWGEIHRRYARMLEEDFLIVGLKVGRSDIHTYVYTYIMYDGLEKAVQ